MQVKLLFVTVYLNGKLHAVSLRKLSALMSDFWILTIESKPNFGILHIPSVPASNNCVSVFILRSLYVWCLANMVTNRCHIFSRQQIDTGLQNRLGSVLCMNQNWSRDSCRKIYYKMSKSGSTILINLHWDFTCLPCYTAKPIRNQVLCSFIV